MFKAIDNMTMQHKQMDARGSLLLALPLQIHSTGSKAWIEPQAANGIDQWLRHFSRVTLGMPVNRSAPFPEGCKDVEGLGFGDRLRVVPFETGWTPSSFYRHLGGARSKLDALIDEHDYLHFAIGGALGDWASLGALIAAKKRRKFSVWTDRVESRVMWTDAMRHRGKARVWRGFHAMLAHQLERHVIRKADVGLFHGRDTFNAYHRFSARPHLVHNIHLKPTDAISREQLAAKVAGATEGPLKIVYAGRAHPDKAPLEWIETLDIAAKAGVDFHATWYGDGPVLGDARRMVERLGLGGRIAFPGNVSDRAALLQAMRDAHIMLFCHVTPESPRCLIEALASGTPIVGYGSAYSSDLVSGNGGGILTEMAPKTLAAELIGLDRRRDHLARLIESAAADGAGMNDEAVFAHRAELMKAFS